MGWASSVAAERLTQHKVSLAFSIAQGFHVISFDGRRGNSIARLPSTSLFPLSLTNQPVPKFFYEDLTLSTVKPIACSFDPAYLQRNRLFKKAGLHEPFPPLQACIDTKDRRQFRKAPSLIHRFYPPAKVFRIIWAHMGCSPNRRFTYQKQVGARER